MLDPALKRVFGHAASIEMLVRAHAPEYAGRIDFGTLRKLGTELVGEALVRRYPDMLWTARVRDGDGRIVILLEFQGTDDRLMALRAAVYGLLSVQELFRRMRPAPATDALEVLALVIYHGRGRWKAPTALHTLLPRWVPGDYHVISRDPEEGGATAAQDDLAGAILRFEQERSVAGTQAALRDLRRIGEETGSSFDRFLAECIGAALVSRKRITKDQLREGMTMAQVDTEYERSLEEFGRKWFRQGRREGRRQGRDEGRRQGRDEGWRQGRDEGQAAVLCQLARRRFGREAAARLADLLGDAPDAGTLAEAANAVIDCATADEFLGRVRGASRT